MTSNGFIAVHVGAGHHSESLKKKYQKLCRDACKIGIECLKDGGRSLDAVVEATMILEDSSLTNAGFGSNLTLNGDVECDASVMDGNKLSFGAVGAVSGIKNPVCLAKRLCEHQSSKISYGRVPPSVLVGPGAQVWASEMGIATLPAEELISTKARKIYHHYKRKLDDKDTSKISKRRMDTVGAVCVDAYGNVAAACSSGGIILKYPGRVGQAGMWGCGVWAHNGACSVAASTSGCGEHLIRTTLARTIAEAVTGAADHVPRLHETMKNSFLESEFLDGLESKLGGAIALRYSNDEATGDLLWTHSTNSMILGHMSSHDTTPKSCVSSLDDELVGKKAVVEGICFRL
ncbi:threonine aspartase 1 [Microplitis demolitor]|uniref:threonine aspartase 1 n=1 Tax=Microplitis demolitor TaxID=69319 RepID=UPI0004CC9E46|nr:threonine aspartase 1 [Microplitis demolitor]